MSSLTTPVASLATIGNLCDSKPSIRSPLAFPQSPQLIHFGDLSVLRDLPLASPTDYSVDDDQPSSSSSNLKLIDGQIQLEKVSQLLASQDPYLVDVLNRTLNQIDTSKM